MFKIILSAAFLLLFTGLKAQQAKSKNTDVIEHKEGGNPAVKAQVARQAITAGPRADSVRKFIVSKDTPTKKPEKKPVNNGTQAFPKSLDSVRSAAEDTKFGDGKYHLKSTDRIFDSLTQFIRGKVSTKSPQQTIAKKSHVQQAAKRDEEIGNQKQTQIHNNKV
ncbi:MAG: hypothetical protein JSU03_08270 [Bacteroidetes bacterium]|nr:hypothetical protein [Bacteroidota bacterium]MBS1757258.1 hypothetical protein [Bacteroidota bacterium]